MLEVIQPVCVDAVPAWQLVQVLPSPGEPVFEVGAPDEKECASLLEILDAIKNTVPITSAEIMLLRVFIVEF